MQNLFGSWGSDCSINLNWYSKNKLNICTDYWTIYNTSIYY